MSLEKRLFPGPAPEERPLPLGRIDRPQRCNLRLGEVGLGDQLEIPHRTRSLYIDSQIGFPANSEQCESLRMRKIEAQPPFRSRCRSIRKLGLAEFIYVESYIFRSNPGVRAQYQSHPPVIDNEILCQMRKAEPSGALSLFTSEESRILGEFGAGLGLPFPDMDFTPRKPSAGREAR